MIQKARLWATGDWQLHHNNAPTCSCITSLAKIFGEISNHPGVAAPYSPDLVNCIYCLFPKLKSPLKRKRFQIINKIQENMMGQLMAIGRTV